MKITFLFSSFLLNGQAQQSVNSLINGSSESLAKSGKVLPASPNASSIARYGGVDVDLSTGAIQKNIKLKEFKDKGISIPIELDYVSSGLKVDELPTRVGMGWRIRSGGSISRVIRGEDDLLVPRLMPDHVLPSDPEDMYTVDYAYRVRVIGQGDPDPDMFTYQFGDYQGNFFFGENNEIVFMPISNLKVQYNYATATDNTWNFLITTPDGMKYYFGGLTAFEESKYAAASAGGVYKKTAWHLSKIVHPSGYSVSMNYERNFSVNYELGISETHIKLANNSAMGIIYNDMYLDGYIPPFNFSHDQIFLNNSYLTSIIGNNGASVLFGYTVPGYPERLLSTITYKDRSGVTENIYNLNYNMVTMSDNNKLPFLGTLSESDNNGNLLNDGHIFEYYGLNNIPKRHSFSQDHWGFFNGKANNTMIAKPEDEEMQLDFPDATANREPDPEYAIKGLLSDITYPTKGQDHIEYESNNTIEEKDVNPYQTIASQVNSNDDVNYTYSSPSFFTVNYETRIKIKYSCWETATNPVPHHVSAGLKIVKVSDNSTVYEKDFSPPQTNVQEFVYLPSTGFYKLIVYAKANVHNEAELTYRTGTAPNMQEYVAFLGGFRVKRTTTNDGSSNTNNNMVKRYYYGTFTNLERSSQYPVPKPEYFSYLTKTVAFINTFTCSEVISRTYDHKALHCNSFNRMNLHNGQLIKYQNVIESVGGDNFESGAIEHKFSFEPDILPFVVRNGRNISTPMTNTSARSLGEIETNIFAKKNGILVKQSTSINQYTLDNRRNSVFTAYQIGIDGQSPCWAIGTGPNGASVVVGPNPIFHKMFQINLYQLWSIWKYLSTQTKTIYDENGENPLTTTMNYYYDNATNLMLTRIETTDSKGLIIKKQYTYPKDHALPANIYQAMVDRNMQDAKVTEQTFRNGTLLSKEYTNYDQSWFTDHHLIGVKSIDIEKPGSGYGIEERFKFLQYDTYGNPLEFINASGKKESFVWDEKKEHPLARGVNAELQSIAFNSFEDASLGGFTFSGNTQTISDAPTGKKVYQLSSGTIQKNLNPALSYTVSFWANSSGFTVTGGTLLSSWQAPSGWIYYEYKLQGQSTFSLTGTCEVDELRLYPSDAQMESYTYDVNENITSQSDVNGKIIYYEYDSFNRLILVRDMERSILKKICYNYSGQVGNCN